MHGNSKPIFSIELGRISEALVSSGYTSLDQQAQALGVHRNTAWTIVKNKHKLGRLSAKTIDRILNNPQTPPSVRSIVQEYASARRVTGHKKSKPETRSFNIGRY